MALSDGTTSLFGPPAVRVERLERLADGAFTEVDNTPRDGHAATGLSPVVT